MSRWLVLSNALVGLLLVACDGQRSSASVSGLRYDPQGPDRDCGDFRTWREAQDFYIAAGGPAKDPHRLDADRNGIACESLR